MSGRAVIEVKEVSFSYNGGPALRGANLTVYERELVSIVGPNGGGKTTLLKIILGLLKPEAGEVWVLGEAPERTRQRVGYVPQTLHYDRAFPVTVMEVVLMGRLGRKGLRGWLGWRERADREAALRALSAVDLDGFASHPFSALSGGQRQRALIARALVSEPEILLLDEPTAHIDAEVEARLSRIIEDLAARAAVVMVSHDPWFASHMVEHVVCVNRTVTVHPTGRIEGEDLRDFYGKTLRLIRHDQVCHDRSHKHD
jgi:zinc transport system ATP-binding protein